MSRFTTIIDLSDDIEDQGTCISTAPAAEQRPQVDVSDRSEPYYKTWGPDVEELMGVSHTRSATHDAFEALKQTLRRGTTDQSTAFNNTRTMEVSRSPSVVELYAPSSETSVFDAEELVFPDLHALFIVYDDMYFDSRLRSVEVRWSSRMTMCAGLCVYHTGGYCSIRMSEPLLKYRSVKEFRETLLHEMIHAYLFLTKNEKNHEAHGEEFQYHMRRINHITGLNITIYHQFIEEVNHYRKHIWRCTGPCRLRPPYFGFVRRAMNRTPGPSDFWWAEHQVSCGGFYEKISEPQPKRNISSQRVKKIPQKEEKRAFAGTIQLSLGSTSHTSKTSENRSLCLSLKVPSDPTGLKKEVVEARGRSSPVFLNGKQPASFTQMTLARAFSEKKLDPSDISATQPENH